jgi:hypothetical protein
MKTTIKLAAIFFALLITVACSPDKPTPEPKPDPIDNNDGDDNGDDNNGGDDDGYVAGTGTGTYISGFVDNNTFDVYYDCGSFYAYPDLYYDYIVILTSGGKGVPGGGQFGYFALMLDGEKYISTQSYNQEYERLITELRDTTSHLERDGICDYPNPLGVTAMEAFAPGMVSATKGIKDLVITSEPQYTSTIAAGEPINEVFNLLYSDMAGFVWKGYERPADSYALWIIPYTEGRFQQYNTWQLWFDLPAYCVNVPAEDKSAYCNIDYIGQDVVLFPKIMPDDVEREYTFTFKVEFTDGTVVTKQVTTKLIDLGAIPARVKL